MVLPLFLPMNVHFVINYKYLPTDCKFNRWLLWWHFVHTHAPEVTHYLENLSKYVSIMLRVDAASKSLFEKRSTDTHVSHVANPFIGLKDYKGVLQSRVLCALNLYWPIYCHREIFWNCLRVPQCSLRTADAFPVVATGNASAVRRLATMWNKA